MDPTAIVELPRTHISCPWRFWDCFLARCGWENLATKRWPWMRNHFSESAWNPSVWRSPQQIKCLGISVHVFLYPQHSCPFQKVTFACRLGACFLSTKNIHWRIQLGQRICMGVDFIPTKRAHNLHISTPIHLGKTSYHNTLHSGWRRFIICPNRFVIRSCVGDVFCLQKSSPFWNGKQISCCGFFRAMPLTEN